MGSMVLWMGVLASATAHAQDVLYQSGLMTQPGQPYGYDVSAQQYLGVRFHNPVTWRIQELGAHAFGNSGTDDALFIALVPLDNDQDLPEDLALSDAIWAASFGAPPFSEDVLIPANILLPPGWWGLVIGGGGPFGSDGTGGLAAYQPAVDSPSYFRMQSGVWEQSTSPGKRFLVKGYLPCFGSGETGDTGETVCPEDCFDGLDDDKDGLTDCQDPDCWHLVACCDGDGDGFTRDDLMCGFGGDCNDLLPLGATVHPFAPELVGDGVDQNCDGVDVCWEDLDGDGFGGSSIVLASGLVCDEEPTAAPSPNDCDDVSSDAPFRYPGAPEIPGDGIDQDCDGLDACYVDLDGDGFAGSTVLWNAAPSCDGQPGLGSVIEDCDDASVEVFPGHVEVVGDGVDQDCDGNDSCFRDLDQDGFGGATIVVGSGLDCDAQVSLTSQGGDCLDEGAGASTAFPGGTEVGGDGVDQDCDGVDACFADLDGDGVGAGVALPGVSLSCDDAVGWSSLASDCDDTSVDISPFAVDVLGDGIDQNCDGVDRCYYDLDGDGFGGPVEGPGVSLDCADEGTASANDDCVDVGPGAVLVFPGASEVPADGVDQNCDGIELCFADADGDGFAGTGTIDSLDVACDNGPGEFVLAQDCDDTNAAIHPLAEEQVADQVDQNCDGEELCYLDGDGDQHGTAEVISVPNLNCLAYPGASPWPDDCNDQDPTISPGLPDIPYNAVDEDCDGVDTRDVDGDGFESVAVNGDDCDDTRVTTFPGAIELQNGRDDDCDGSIDEGTPAADDDLDGFAELGGDCDDADPSASPAGVEVCDGVDNDCDGLYDEDTVCSDDDGDGWTEVEGDCVDSDPAISPEAPEVPANGIDDNCDGYQLGDVDDVDGDGVSEAAGDCAPLDADVHPGHVEVADGRDNDCDGVIDEGTDAYDDDVDGYAESEGDCHDGDATIHPGATERSNGIDDDCDGQVDEHGPWVDDDQDGVSTLDGDCDDTDPSVHPGIVEQLDGVDNDCDGLVDEGLRDQDRDGYAVEEGDCRDDRPFVHPGHPEVCDGMDNNCDGLVDEGCAGQIGPDPVAPVPGCSTLGATPVWPRLAWLMVCAGAFSTRRRARRATMR